MYVEVGRRGCVVERILEVDVAGGCVVELSSACEVHDVGELHDVGLITCVGQAIVQGDEGPVSEVAQGVQVHGVDVRHGEKQEKEEGEAKQEVEGEKEENAQTTMRMSMDGMTMEDTCERP